MDLPFANLRRFIGRLSVLTALTLGSTAFAQGTPLQWGACPFANDGSVQCANLAVPLDYREPSGTKISVAISRRKAANPALRRGVLLLNPGGPGGPGLDLPSGLASLYPQSVLDAYDLIGFDPRGIEHSSGVTCGLDPTPALRAFIPIELRDGFDATAALQKASAAGCGANSGQVLPFINTANTARDMDQIRQALGEQKISYLGYSYGTYLGAVYASLFPDRTDRFVLDSNVDPRWIWRTQFREWGPAFALRFPDFLKYAAANDATYHLGTDPRQIEHEFFPIASSLHANPLELPDGTSFDDQWFRFVAFSLVYNDADFPLLAQFWQVLKDAPTVAAVYPLFKEAGIRPAPIPGLPADTDEVAGTSVLCGDVEWSRSVDQYRAELKGDSRFFPITAPFSSNIYPCAFWPTNPSEPLVQISSKGPSNILMLQNLRDPGTPYWGALQMRQALGSRARLVSIDQGGHGIYQLMKNECANNAATAWLTGGPFPASDEFCPAEPTPSMTPFATTRNEQSRRTIVHEMTRRMRHP